MLLLELTMMINDDDEAPLTKRDRRKSNKGRAKHGKYMKEEKAELIYKWEIYHNDAGKRVSDFVEDEAAGQPILETLLDCAGVSGSHEILNRLWVNVARSIQKS
jgi:hypothetical protein